MPKTSNTSSATQDMQDIIDLAKLLRNNGDKVLSAASKLSLTSSLLNKLNDAFSQIVHETGDLESSFQVCNSSRNEIFRDIKFLHDFVQKTVGLKLTNTSNERWMCDIAKFRHLKFLELQKIPVGNIKGIQGVRGQLECIICSGARSINNIRDLLETCGADEGVGFIWGSLRRLAIPYNNLTSLDKSLEYVPWLQTLDLSHNHIKNASDLAYLPNLKNVNLGYNNLESVPCFHRAASHTLEKLILKNNYIESIDELQNLECLVDLDLSFNCLTDHSNLWPLETMTDLLSLSLEGNPLSYHPRHRLHCIKHLHPSLSEAKFTLDSAALNRAEKLFVSENRICALRSLNIRSKEDLLSLNNSISSDISSVSIETLRRTDSMSQSQSIECIPNIDIVASRTRKKKNVPEAIIADVDTDIESRDASQLSKSYMETSTDHLETKRQILALRAKFGEDNWLSSHAGTYIQNIMGIQISVPNIEERITSSPIASASTLEDPRINDLQTVSPIMISIVQEKNEKELDKDDEDWQLENDNAQEVNVDSNNKINLEVELSNSQDLEDEPGDLYLVQKLKSNSDPEEVFLVITDDYIKEKDSITGKLKYSWALSTILSCVMGRGENITVEILFDTRRKDRDSRKYIVEKEDAKKIVQTLTDSIKSRPMLLKIFKCMLCATHFSTDDESSAPVTVSGTNHPPKCPTCKSTLVIQTDELSGPNESSEKSSMSVPSKNLPGETSTQATLRHSESQSSIGGIEAGATLITDSQMYSDSDPRVHAICSATSLDDSRESTPSAATVTKKYDSDIEVLSNPSQSSIEVLDDGSKLTHKQNQSFDNQQKYKSSNASDLNPIMTGLTESSSSGSLTDSVCTAYENKHVKVLDKNDTLRSINDSTEKSNENMSSETVFAPVMNLTTMLGDLLQSMKIGPSKDTVSDVSEEQSEFIGSHIQYSYTNFNTVDHRIKLHIILNVFEHENEELALLLRADLLTQASPHPFPGCVVLSTAKLYVLKITGMEGENPQKWLIKETSWTIDRLRSFSPLPFKQGVLIEFDSPNIPGEVISNNNYIVCVLQDFQRTSNFLFYLTDSPLPASCEVEFTVPQYCNTSIRDALKMAKFYKQDEPVRILALFSSALIKYNDERRQLELSSLIITSSTLIILEDKLHWLLPNNASTPLIVAEQALSNLIEIDFNKAQLNLNFLDEIAGYEVNWLIEFNSENAAEAVINSIRPPWEELFSVPLQINTPGTDNPEST